MTDILLQSLAFAIVGPMLGCIVGLATLAIAAYVALIDQAAANFIGFIGLIFGASIAIAGVSKAVFLFVKVAF